jgi:beta-lactamase regulating signal transducer with metallopeptidase domain
VRGAAADQHRDASGRRPLRRRLRRSRGGRGAGFGSAAAQGTADTSALAALPALLDDGTLSNWQTALRRQLPWVVGLWLAGAALMSLRLAVGLKWVAERTRPEEYTVNHYWQRRLSELARRFDIGQHVRLGVAELLDSPITAGCWRPIVLVPSSLDQRHAAGSARSAAGA